MCSENVLYFNEESIDRERIITDSEPDVLNELFCPICFCLLWKPRSCSLCQNLFCNKCIQIWLNENSHTCPLCRSLYEEKLASPSIQSTLSHYSIRCRNNSFGCTEILSYDLLEEHENNQCQFLTKTCRICEQIILQTDIEEHKNLCKPMVMQCPLCQYSIKTELFEYHEEECLRRYEYLNEELLSSLNFANEPILSTISTADFTGIEIFNQSRNKNCFIRLYAMIQLILLNLPVIHLILLNLFGWGCGNFIRISSNSFVYFQSWIHTSIYQAFIFITIFSILFNYSLFFLLELLNDMLIISFIIISLIIWSSISLKIPINQFEMNFNFKEILLFFILIFLGLEIPLLIIRFYFSYISIRISTICLIINIFFFSKYSRKSNYFS